MKLQLNVSKNILIHSVLFKGIITFLELDYGDVSLIILYRVVQGIIILNKDIIQKKLSKNFNMF